MHILFVHNNFPGQYRRISDYLKNFPEYKMTAASLATNKQKSPFLKIGYEPHRQATKGIHRSLVSTENAVIMGQAGYAALLKLKDKGLKPDIVMAHSGWGASLFLKDLFPEAKFLTYFEWYYHCHGGDAEFFRDEPYGPNDELRIRMKNTSILHELAAMDWGQSPTKFQHGQFPKIFQKNISVLHDGVDVDYFSPAEGAVLKVGDKELTAEDEVVTYVARGMEDYRGFTQFMETVSILQKQRPNMHVVILGKDRVAYGAQRADGKTYKEWALEKFTFDHDRLHFMGLMPLKYFRDMMRITSAHVYLTAPFVLSWSLMEAMSTGALIVGSDTAPLHEMITDGENGLLVPFFNVDKIVDQVNQVLNKKSDYQGLRNKARRTIVESYATRDLLPKYKHLIETVANGSHI